MHLMASLSFMKNCLLHLSLLGENVLEDAIFEGNLIFHLIPINWPIPCFDTWVPPGTAGAQPASLGGPLLSASPSSWGAAWMGSLCPGVLLPWASRAHPCLWNPPPSHPPMTSHLAGRLASPAMSLQWWPSTSRYPLRLLRTKMFIHRFTEMLDPSESTVHPNKQADIHTDLHTHFTHLRAHIQHLHLWTCPHEHTAYTHA